MKKAGIYLMVLVLMVTGFMGCAKQQSEPLKVWIESVEAKAGELVTVEIWASKDAAIAATDLLVDFDPQQMTYQSFTPGSAYQGTSDANLDDEDTVHMVMVTLTPPQEREVLATVTFQLAKDAAGSIPLTLRYESCCDIDMVNLTPECENGTIYVK